jgi:MFS family permease
VVITEDTPPFQYENGKECKLSINYRAWPIFLLSFLRLITISIFDRAFLNYVYFYRNINESTLGFISSATAAAYIFGPLIGHFITSKLGINNSIILSTIATPLLMGAQMIFFAPWYLIFIRVLNGLLLGVYWPNCYNLLSRWQSVSTPEKSKSNFKNYNYSWNLGFILGLLSGFFLASLLNEYIAMTIAWLLSFLMLPVSFFLKKESELNHLADVNNNYHEDTEILREKVNHNSNNNSNHRMILYPILFSWLTLLTYTMSKAIVRFSYPVFLKDFGEPSYYTYLNQLAVQIGQLSGLTLINHIKIYYRKLTVFISIISITIISLTIMLIQDMLYISIISSSIGIFIGFIQGTSLKIMIDYGASRNTKKYSTINEVIKGVGFGLTPILAGFIAEINVYANFLVLLIFGIFSLITLIFLSRNVKKEGNLVS